jgi:hypothetical protein
MRHAARNGARLARARASQYQQWAALMLNSFVLSLI